MPPTPPHPDVTRLVNAAAGDKGAADRLLELVYDQLRKAAQQNLATERTGHTLSATVLVHEAYIKLIGPRDVPWSGRGHFYAAAAQAMRRILVDYARARAAAVRGGAGPDSSAAPAARRAALDLGRLPDLHSDTESAGFLILEDAIARFETVDADAAAVVRLRYFAGLSIEQTAVALGVSEPTVKRAWTFARGWLMEAIQSRR